MSPLPPDVVARAREIGQQAPALTEEKRQRLREIFRRGQRDRTETQPATRAS